ncbi:hypothetical protein MRX96_001628 [Rhipicephalus microplus]
MSEALPLSPEDVRQAQESDGECRALTSFCQNGWNHRRLRSRSHSEHCLLWNPSELLQCNHPIPLDCPPADCDHSDGVTRTRSGRRVVPPNRLNL